LDITGAVFIRKYLVVSFVGDAQLAEAPKQRQMMFNVGKDKSHLIVFTEMS